jgi:hypothetical protein
MDQDTNPILDNHLDYLFSVYDDIKHRLMVKGGLMANSTANGFCQVVLDAASFVDKSSSSGSESSASQGGGDEDDAEEAPSVKCPWVQGKRGHFDT